MNSIMVNGVRIEAPDGASVSVINGVVHINGVANNAAGKLQGIVDLKVEGRIGSVRVDHGSITCENVEGNVHAMGSVTVRGNVLCNVDAGGSVNCGDVGGGVDAGGSVNCGNVSGDVDAGGSVMHK